MYLIIVVQTNKSMIVPKFCSTVSARTMSDSGNYTWDDRSILIRSIVKFV